MPILIFILLFSLCISANDYSKEANYLFNNRASIKQYRAFLEGDYPESEKRWVIQYLVRFTDEEAKALFHELSKSSDEKRQAVAAILLMNAGDFQKGFSIFKKLAKKQSEAVTELCYHPYFLGEYSEAKRTIYTQYGKTLLPFLEKQIQKEELPIDITAPLAMTILQWKESPVALRRLNEIAFGAPEKEWFTSERDKEFLKNQRLREQTQKWFWSNRPNQERAELIKVTLSHPKLNQYLHSSHSGRDTLYIQNDVSAYAKIDLSKPVVIESKTALNKTNHFIIHSILSYAPDSRKVTFSYPIEGVKGSAKLKRRVDGWEVMEMSIVEN